jgi:hypothetical protein
MLTEETATRAKRRTGKRNDGGRICIYGIMKTIEEKNKIIITAFTMFLKANDAYVPYRRALIEERKDTNFSFINTIISKKEENVEYRWNHFIFSAFTWCNTAEARNNASYWANLHTKWGKILIQIKNNDYKLSKDMDFYMLTK